MVVQAVFLSIFWSSGVLRTFFVQVTYESVFRCRYHRYARVARPCIHGLILCKRFSKEYFYLGHISNDLPVGVSQILALSRPT